MVPPQTAQILFPDVDPSIVLVSPLQVPFYSQCSKHGPSYSMMALITSCAATAAFHCLFWTVHGLFSTLSPPFIDLT